MEDDLDGKINLDGKRPDLGYDGTRQPVRLEDVDDADADAVILGALQADGHIITAEGKGELVVEHVR